MSKIVYLCTRHGASLSCDSRDLERVFTRLTPGKLQPRPPLIIEDEGILIGILNPIDDLPVQGNSVCMGVLFDHRADWWRPGAEIPDGSYALFRGDGEKLELASDIVASRTIWYVQTENLFIASTSQRAIVCFLKGYEPNEAVHSWMLSTGTLGPGLSWDRRIRCLEADSRLKLDRRTWHVSIERKPAEFTPEDLPSMEHEQRLRAAMESTFASLDVDNAKWVLPLSGGHDSRAILQMLRNRQNLKAVTWGLKSALEDRQSDAWVAREVAQRFGVEHEYLETDRTDEAIEIVLDRFLAAGEGRTDHIAGYMDGFALWKRLHDAGCQGILRGDEAFGWKPVNTSYGVVRSVGMMRLSDYRNMQASGLAGAYEQLVPAMLQRISGESLETWRDRLYQTFRIPVILAALNELKSAYVEIANPFLSRAVIDQVRRMPAAMRTDKQLFRKIVENTPPAIPFADYPAIEAQANILGNPAFIGPIIRELNGSHAREIFPEKILEYLEKNVTRSVKSRPTSVSNAKRLKSFIKRLLPGKVTTIIKSSIARIQSGPPQEAIDANRLAFRAYIICRMDDLLRRDAMLLNHRDS